MRIIFFLRYCVKEEQFKTDLYDRYPLIIKYKATPYAPIENNLLIIVGMPSRYPLT